MAVPVGRIRGKLGSLLTRARRQRGVAWEANGRLHLRIGPKAGMGDPTRRREIEQAVEALPGVRWARGNPRLGCLVVAFADDAARQRGWESLAELAVRDSWMEGSLSGQSPDRHPGDLAPIVRTWLEISADVASLGVGLALRRLSKRAPVLELDMAALVELVSGVPRFRRALELLVGDAGAEVALELLRAVTHSLLHSESGPLVSIVRRLLCLRELSARRLLWEHIEGELCGTADAAQSLPPLKSARPVPRPPSPIETYTDSAAAATLGAFVTGLIATRDRDGASGTIFAGLPKPARYGRDAFARHLSVRLSRSGILVLDRERLRDLDCVDWVVVDRTLVAEIGGEEAVMRRLRAAFGDQFSVVAPGVDAEAHIRDRQIAGRVVAAVGPANWPGLAAADLGVAASPSEGGSPWSADVICFGPPGRALAFVCAAPTARKVAVEGLVISALETGLAIGIALTGFGRRATRRIMYVSSAASLLSMINGVRRAGAIPLAGDMDPTAGERKGGGQAPKWHELGSSDVLRRLQSSELGLSEAQAKERRPPLAAPPTRLVRCSQIIVEELRSPMTAVLGAGAGLALFSGEPIDALLIASVSAANTALAAVQRMRADDAIRRLAAADRGRLRVRRNAVAVATYPELLVPGDVVELAAPELIPADCRILYAEALEVDESALTGEPIPVAKDPTRRAVDSVAERSNMLYDGTTIVTGTAVAAVVATGTETEAGRALQLAATAGPARGVEAKLERLAALTVPIALASGAVLMLGARRRDLRGSLRSAVGLAVAAVPEGLPLLATVAQAAAAERLSRQGAVIRSFRAIEALGRIDVLCADKTGTLTQGRIELCEVSDGITSLGVEQLAAGHRGILSAALRASPSTTSGEVLAHATDRALVRAAHRRGINSHDNLHHWTRLQQVPFQSRRGFHAGMGGHGGGAILSVKGAPEYLLPRCSRWLRDGAWRLGAAERRHLQREAERLAALGYRILAVVEREADRQELVDEDALRDLDFLGFLAFADPIRTSARAAVDDLRRAGVDTIMITGDHPTTAETIAGSLGLVNQGPVLTGAEIEAMSDAALERRLAGTSVVARASPAQKLRVVVALRRMKRVVAMAGDGANDAAAIRLADVGIALGERASPAARGAAGIIIADERIETLVAATLEGRALWASVRDAVSVLVGGNLGEILFTTAAGVAQGSSPLSARQLLLVNLLTDALPAVALAVQPPAVDRPELLAREGPEMSLGRALSRDLAWRTASAAGAATGAWWLTRHAERQVASTAALVALTGSQLAGTLVVGRRSPSVVVASLGSGAALALAVQTPVLSRFLECRPLDRRAGAAAGLAVLVSAAVSVVRGLLEDHAASSRDAGSMATNSPLR